MKREKIRFVGREDEIKYILGKMGVEVIDEFEKKLHLMKRPKNKTIEKILISAGGANDTLTSRAYFDRIITLEDFFSE
ncbi:MAG: hypothetical protein S4CHLAM45_11610 [Chlamydiales bacterium]|nr:hypothetical protein [Chlamydiales bacterium]MCH9619653.1 hypothetical protein [Chlamydiales bacterium]MCH9623259.1 hypothetical protein [Chlamydiales bacterium]